MYTCRYVEYQTGEQSSANIDFDKVDFVEWFAVTEDPWHMHNHYNNSGGVGPGGAGNEAAALHTELRHWFGCAGDACP